MPAQNAQHIDIDLSRIIPIVVRHTAIPSVYSPEEIEWLRASDISALTFDSLYRNKGAIEIIQKKPKTPLSLPLTDEVIAALDDYFGNGRPQSEDEHVFLNLRGYGVQLPASIGSILHSSLQRVLGQSSIQAIKSHVKTEVELLRVGALPVSLPSGDFEALLESGGV